MERIGLRFEKKKFQIFFICSLCLSVFMPPLPEVICPNVLDFRNPWRTFLKRKKSLLRYRIHVFLPPFPEVGCQKFPKIQNPWVKIMERNGLRFEKN